MKQVKKIAAQGDLVVIRREKVPDGFEETENKVVAHSETGHNHVAVGDCIHFANPDDVMRSFLVAKGPVVLEHHRSFDTHEALELLSEGEGEVVWEIRRQREYVPEGWRRVED